MFDLLGLSFELGSVVVASVLYMQSGPVQHCYLTPDAHSIIDLTRCSQDAAQTFAMGYKENRGELRSAWVKPLEQKQNVGWAFQNFTF